MCAGWVWLAPRPGAASGECLAPVDSRVGNPPRAAARTRPGVPTSQAPWPSSHGGGGRWRGARVARPQGPQDSRGTPPAALETDGAREINEEGVRVWNDSLPNARRATPAPPSPGACCCTGWAQAACQTASGPLALQGARRQRLRRRYNCFPVPHGCQRECETHRGAGRAKARQGSPRWMAGRQRPGHPTAE